MAKHYLPDISVQMVPNGYVLKFKGAKQPGVYLYFSVEELLKGFMLHIGLKMTDQLNKENIDDFMTAAMNWPENEKCIKEINRLQTQLRVANRNRHSLALKLIQERRRFLELVDDVNGAVCTFKRHKDVAEMLSKFVSHYSGVKHLTFKSLGATDLKNMPDEPVDDEEDEE